MKTFEPKMHILPEQQKRQLDAPIGQRGFGNLHNDTTLRQYLYD